MREMTTHRPTNVPPLRSDSTVKTNPKDPKTIQCFNCLGWGHLSSTCPKPKRQKGSCFRCGSIQHTLKDCPESTFSPNAPVALLSETEYLNPQQVNEGNISSSSFHNGFSELNRSG